MKNSFRLVLTAILAVFVFGAANQIKAQGPAQIRLLYAKMAQNQKTLKSLKTTIRMIKINPQIPDEKDAREGTALFLPSGAKSANVRIDWTEGTKETLSVVDGKYLLYQPGLSQALEGKTDKVQKQEGALDFIKMSSAEIKQKFNAEWLGGEIVAETQSAYKLKLTPKTPMSYNYAEIWVKEDGMPIQFKVYEKNGDTTTVLLHHIERNAKISKNQLKLNLPKGVKVIKG